MPEDDNFFSRWSRRKVQVQQGVAVPEVAATIGPAVASSSVPAVAAVATEPAVTALGTRTATPTDTEGVARPPPPTLEDAQRLTTSDDFSRFVGRDVSPQVKNTALRTLFSDPHFNVMDGLDTYIDDYGKPDPLPAGMLRQMVQSTMLRLFEDEPKDNPPAASASEPDRDTAPDVLSTPALPPEPAPHEDTALRLQPHDDAGHTSHRQGACEDAGRQL